MKILLVINGTAQQIDILEARRLRRALNAKLAAARRQCKSCGRLTLPLDECEECGSSI